MLNSSSDEPLDGLRQPADPNMPPDSERTVAPSQPNLQTRQEQAKTRAKAIESKAGMGLKRRYWQDLVQTPIGELSRRAVVFTMLGIFMIYGLFLVVADWQLREIPTPNDLPPADALTVMTHLHANFSGNTLGDFGPFIPQEGALWRHQQGYQFRWQDDQGAIYDVLVLEYGSWQDLAADYYLYTRSVDSSQRAQVAAQTVDLLIEGRSLDAYGADWKGLQLENILLLMSRQTPPASQDELYSHIVTILAANHRDNVPTATPFG